MPNTILFGNSYIHILIQKKKNSFKNDQIGLLHELLFIYSLIGTQIIMHTTLMTDQQSL